MAIPGSRQRRRRSLRDASRCCEVRVARQPAPEIEPRREHTKSPQKLSFSNVLTNWNRWAVGVRPSAGPPTWTDLHAASCELGLFSHPESCVLSFSPAQSKARAKPTPTHRENRPPVSTSCLCSSFFPSTDSLTCTHAHEASGPLTRSPTRRNSGGIPSIWNPVPRRAASVALHGQLQLTTSIACHSPPCCWASERQRRNVALR